VTKSPAEKGDFKGQMLTVLQTQSPKLAALIQNSSVEIEEKTVRITVDQDFSRNLLVNSKDLVEKIMKKILKRDVSLLVETGEKKKENNLENAIRALFDGEEVR
jgi:hypothetical protein